MNQTPAVARTGSGAGRTLLFAALATTLAATPGYSLGEVSGGTVDLNIVGELMSDSNVFGNLSEENDIVYTVRPELAFNREGSRGTTHLDAGAAVNRYFDFTELDSTDWYVNGVIALPEGKAGKLSGDLSLAYFDGSEVDEYVAQRINIKSLNFAAKTQYEMSGRTSLRLGADLTSYDTDIRPQTDSWSLSTGISLRLRQKISGFFDYSYGRASTESVPAAENVVDYTAHSFNVGLNGSLSQTVTGEVSVGVQKISAGSSDTAGDRTNMVSNATLTWAPRRTTTFKLLGGQESRVTTDARAIDAVNASVGVEQIVNSSVKATASFLWETFKTQGVANSTDDRVAATLDVVYTVNDRLALGGNVEYNVRWSYNPLYDISRTALKAYARIKF